jgi:hypothetical protein
MGFSIECVRCGETVEAPDLASPPLEHPTIRAAVCGGCGQQVEFLYNGAHDPFGARLVLTGGRVT